MPKETDIADAIGRILAHVHRSPPLDCDPSRVDELMAIYPRPPRGRSGAVDQVTLAMAGIIGRKPRHPQPLFRWTPHPQHVTPERPSSPAFFPTKTPHPQPFSPRSGEKGVDLSPSPVFDGRGGRG